jgi:hypothetical protein
MPLEPPSREIIENAIAVWKRVGAKSAAARELNIPKSTFCGWLDIAQRIYHIKLPDPQATPAAKGRREIDLDNGLVLVGSDPHYWPGDASTAHRAFVNFCKKLKPAVVVMNGDALDLPRVSRHPPPGWTRMPETKDELEVCAERLGEIAKAAGKAKKLWPWGNHDQRFEVYLATHAPEVAGVKGTRLLDHFPDWEPCWSVFVNNRPGGLVIKHRHRGGIHATWNNVIYAGRSIATGHLHSQRVTPITDYNGTRYGIDVGTMADIYAPQFQYLEDNPRNWRSGFAVFRFDSGALLPPELVTVLEPGVVAFRGELIEV